jgi:DNA processing protein
VAHDDRHLHLLALCAIPDVSWYVIARGAQDPQGLERLLAGERTEKSAEAVKTALAIKRGLPDLRQHLARAAGELERAEDQVGARLVTVLDDDYPANLRVIFNLPPFLLYRGELRRDDARSVAVVGTREASADGLRRAREMAGGLAAEKVTVLSGLARGIDTAAHEETLAGGGRTIAVLGTGILHTYPQENADLAERIAETGALVSQFWPSQRPARYTFPRRNVVTSGMGQGTLVIEASRTSGAKMQARLALQHGKLVFLVQSLVTSQPWAQRYLDKQQRAIQVAGVDDVLSFLRSPEGVESVSEGRRQLALGLS